MDRIALHNLPKYRGVVFIDHTLKQALLVRNKTADLLENEIAGLELYGRPIICTEWMARTCGSLVGTHLPVFASRKVCCINWGLVAGKINTLFAWQDLENPMNRIDPSSSEECGEPQVWFYNLFRQDGTPYDPAEIEAFRKYARMRTQRSGAIMGEPA
jgi:hypothetical protein